MAICARVLRHHLHGSLWTDSLWTQWLEACQLSKHWDNDANDDPNVHWVRVFHACQPVYPLAPPPPHRYLALSVLELIDIENWGCSID
jgi:hypothetical protein